MNLLYRLAYNGAIIGMTVLDVVIDITGPPCDCAHHTVDGDVLHRRTILGHQFWRFG